MIEVIGKNSDKVKEFLEKAIYDQCTYSFINIVKSGGLLIVLPETIDYYTKLYKNDEEKLTMFLNEFSQKIKEKKCIINLDMNTEFSSISFVTNLRSCNGFDYNIKDMILNDVTTSRIFGKSHKPSKNNCYVISYDRYTENKSKLETVQYFINESFRFNPDKVVEIEKPVEVLGIFRKTTRKYIFTANVEKIQYKELINIINAFKIL